MSSRVGQATGTSSGPTDAGDRVQPDAGKALGRPSPPSLAGCSWARGCVSVFLNSQNGNHLWPISWSYAEDWNEIIPWLNSFPIVSNDFTPSVFCQWQQKNLTRKRRRKAGSREGGKKEERKRGSKGGREKRINFKFLSWPLHGSVVTNIGGSDCVDKSQTINAQGR